MTMMRPRSGAVRAVAEQLVDDDDVDDDDDGNGGNDDDDNDINDNDKDNDDETKKDHLKVGQLEKAMQALLEGKVLLS